MSNDRRRRSLNAAVTDGRVPVLTPQKNRHAPNDHVPLNRPTTVAKPKRPTPETSTAPTVVDENLGKGERTVLGVLAQWPEGRTHSELAFLAGYSAKASTLSVILGKLRRLGYVEAGQPIRITPEGLEAAGGPQELPSGPELLAHWHGHPRMGEGERRVLDVLMDHYPEALSNEQLCEATGYSPTASTVSVILGKLRKLGLVEKGVRRVVPEFMESVAS